MTEGPPPDQFKYMTKTQRAMTAARLATRPKGFTAQDEKYANVPTQAEAAKVMGINRDTVVSARIVLTHGTPEEIRMADSGDVALNALVAQIRPRLPPLPRGHHYGENFYRPKTKTAGQNAERLARRKLNADLWSKLRDALDGLTSLPLPGDTVKAVRGGGGTVVKKVDEKLQRAIQWLTEFSDAWNRQNEAKQAQDRNNHADASDGDRVAGAQQAKPPGEPEPR